MLTGNEAYGRRQRSRESQSLIVSHLMMSRHRLTVKAPNTRQHSMFLSGRLLVVAFAVTSVVDAFITKASQPLKATLANGPPVRQGLFMAADTEGCGCQVAVQFDGVPTEAARKLDHRQAIRQHPVYSSSGKAYNMDDLIGEPNMGQISVVVFLRSLG